MRMLLFLPVPILKMPQKIDKYLQQIFRKDKGTKVQCKNLALLSEMDFKKKKKQALKEVIFQDAKYLC